MVEQTVQMMPTSRNLGNSAETSIETALVNTNRTPATRTTSSQVQVGSTPNASTNTNATRRFGTRLKTLTSTTESGITSRGNCVLRTTASCATIDPTASPVASWKKPNRTMLNSRNTG